MPPQIPQETSAQSSVYGPVASWRVGKSLGVDLLLQTSTCSFNCIYCQLGDIQDKTIERKIYVPTDQLERDLKNSDWQSADIITFSGSGEPTLGLNLAEAIYMIKEYTHKPVMVLTNGTTLHDPAVQQDLLNADQVSIKLDAASDEVLTRMNRPVAGVSMEKILEGIHAFKKIYRGKLCLQCMFMPANIEEAEEMADLIAEIEPDEVQLNTPKRPYPRQWVLDSRGNHGTPDYPTIALKTVSEDEAEMLESVIRKKLTGKKTEVSSVYRKAPV